MCSRSDCDGKWGLPPRFAQAFYATEDLEHDPADRALNRVSKRCSVLTVVDIMAICGARFG